MPVGLGGRGGGREGGYAIRAAEYFDKRAHVSRGVRRYLYTRTALTRLRNRGAKDGARR